jgi:hypothetical protein
VRSRGQAVGWLWGEGGGGSLRCAYRANQVRAILLSSLPPNWVVSECAGSTL